MSRGHAALCLALAIAVAEIPAGGQGPLANYGVQTDVPERFTRRVVTTGLENPWEMLWGPDGRLWVTERTGKRIVRIDPATGSKVVALVVPDAYSTEGQDGTVGMALHSAFLKSRSLDYLYLVLTYNADPGPGVSRRMMLRRYTFHADTGRLGEPLNLLTDLPAADDHTGGRLVFGPDDKLYLTLGDQAANHQWTACLPNHAQTLPAAGDIAKRAWDNYAGKILRINLDGSIPSDNPLLAGVRSHVYSYGHRNPQGLAFGPNGALYESEHGPSTDDEVNLIQGGKNYGWPFVAGYRDDRAYVYANWSASSPAPCSSLTFDPIVAPASVPQQKESAWNDPAFVPPLRTFFTVDAGYGFKELGNASIAPSGIDLYTKAAGIPGWANSLLVTSLKFGSVFRLKLSSSGTSVSGPTMEYFRTGPGARYRDVATSPDGLTIYVCVDSTGSTQSPGAILAFSYERPGGI